MYYLIRILKTAYQSIRFSLAPTYILATIVFLAPIPSYASFPNLIATKGYIYGFPLVLMGETLEGMTGPERVCGLGTDINTFAHVYDRPDPEFKAVVRPNVDTLYSSAMLDLSKGPQLLEMPPLQNRYVLMAFLDAWSNNFAGVGTQAHGNDVGRYAIVTSRFRGQIPAGYTPIVAPTDLVWIIGRTEVRGDDDVSVVNAIQDQYKLYPLHGEKSESDITSCIPASEKTPPIEIVKALSGQEFFTRLATLMEKYPAPKSDRRMLRSLGRIGVGPRATHTVDQLGKRKLNAIENGRTKALKGLELANLLLGLNGWGPNPAIIPLGDYKKRYLVRAVVSQIGFGANKGEFAVYQNTMRDSERQLLTGDATYKLTFKASDLPPVKAFWSLTVYGDDGFLRDNRSAEALGIKRYAVGSNTGLIPDENGDISVYFSHQPPVGVPLQNWLPVPKDSFQVTVRLYDPEKAVLSNRWKVPPLEKVPSLAELTLD
ncbi:MAG: DUF1254 domain-containing protein [Pseudomonadales bacterium]|nr:DUF1254 domain-containing protein [Pseudomonadales bacterium]